MKPSGKRSPGRPKATGQEDATVKELILQTASTLFMEHGYDNVSLEQIANQCGVTKASVYYYYTNKPTLFTTSVVQMMANIRRYTLLILQQEGSLKERLQRIASAYLRQSHVEFDTLMREAGTSLSQEQLKEMREAENAVHREMAAEFAKAMEQGEIRKANPLLAAHAFASLMMLGNRVEAGDLFLAKDKAAEDIVDLFWNGVISPHNG
ncbi:TetR/AcrR family transcriptional regulator [Paenibacillus aurantius]|uniref:TetR/AcrR family transcriptional regulator n=1 Tax=Paenibacillus aurantius TaxID=2918900 RepID=A0AA96LH14_9BACL|nr:TetR/AcrR family transcriptional regulator [Paenibacillus aurantius]WNQ11327.1 TetR/AcrR family transcriptional regulator [Paenibacillus aurantius]